MKKLRVIDFFCGDGGFSEGFRQMGYEIIYGFDHWKPACNTNTTAQIHSVAIRRCNSPETPANARTIAG
jgi:site-specific DNA-cytosine methylase